MNLLARGRCLPPLLACALLLAPGGHALGADAATWIQRANDALLPGDTLTAGVEITTRDGFGGERTIRGTVLHRESEAFDQTLIEIAEPASVAGAVYRITRPVRGPTRRTAYLPAFDRAVRVSGVDRTDHFLGTEFTYEDVGLLAPVERGRGTVARVVYEGRELVKISSEPYHYYARVETYIDPTTHLPVRVDFHDRAGQRFREQIFRDVREVGGHPFPHDVRVRNLLTGASSRMTFVDVDFAVPPAPDAFEARAIERRLRGGGQEPSPDAPSAPAD